MSNETNFTSKNTRDPAEVNRICNEEARKLAVDDGPNGLIFKSALNVFHDIYLADAAAVAAATIFVARVFELTEDGLAEVERTGERIYSPAGVNKFAMNCRANAGFSSKVVKAIIRNARDEKLRNYISPLCGPELIASIDYLHQFNSRHFNTNPS